MTVLGPLAIGVVSGFLIRAVIEPEIMAVIIAFVLGALVVALTFWVAPTCAEDCPEARRIKRTRRRWL